MKFNKNHISKIKLIIWDLDETFWKGTLSDININAPYIIPIDSNISLVKKLSKRGIVNSVCSKNDCELAENELRRLDVLEYFVFNSINWESKGGRIKQMIKDMALRPENVLFIDDNLSNLGEAEYVCPSLLVATPNIIPYLYNNVDSIGKDDRELSRLNQYKVLEKKRLDKQTFTSNHDFLSHSGIKICIIKKPLQYVERITELIARSNQLNFTKKRIDNVEVANLINNPENKTGAVIVEDNYGKYGLVGFYSENNSILEHFVFSCRTMGMGIEQYIYAYLNYPHLDIVGPVSGSVSKELGKPTYITLVDSLEVKENKGQKGLKILLKGPCDLQVMASYIENSGCNITTEFNFCDDKGNQVDFYNHTVNIINSTNIKKEEFEQISKKYNFLSKEAYNTTLFNGNYDVICLSPLMDATLGVYSNGKILLPFGLYNKSLINTENWNDYYQKRVMTARCNFDYKQLEKFRSEFHKHSYTANEIATNFSLIIDKVLRKNANTKFVILLLSELPYKYTKTSPYYALSGKEIYHKEINEKIIELFKERDSIYLLNVNDIVRSQSDYFDNINHYSKLVYYKIAKEFIDYVNSIGGVNIKSKKIYHVLWEHFKRAIYKTFILRLSRFTL